MTAFGYCLFITVVHVPLVTSILFDLLNGLGPRYPQCICAPPPCSAAATASASSVSGGVIAEPAPIGPPVYADEVAPVRPSYAGGYPPRPPPPPVPPFPATYPYRRRTRRDILVEAGSGEQLQDCSSREIGEIIQQGMTSSLQESRDRIHRSLLAHYKNEVIVVCSPHQLHIAVTDGIEFCKESRNEMSCHAFVFQ